MKMGIEMFVSGQIPSRVWTMQEIARHVDVAVATIWNEIQRGNLKAHRLASRIVVFEDDFRTWLQAKRDNRTARVQGRGRKPSTRTDASLAAAAAALA